MRHIPKGAPPLSEKRKPKGEKDKTTVTLAKELVAAARRRACTQDYLLDLIKEEWHRYDVALERAAKRREELANFVPQKVEEDKKK